MNIIETNNLLRRFGRTEAVAGLDLAVTAGSVCALLGPNGAGKSTTIKMLMNLLAPTAGEARVLGVDSRRLGPREFAQIGYVSENQQLPVWMTVRQLMGYCRPFYPTWDPKLERELSAQLGLPQDQRLSQFSRGMLMKAALLSSLAYRPKLLVLDEPFSGLDPLVREELVKSIIEVSAAGSWTVLVSSHDIEEVERMTDHVALLDAGRLRLSEPIDMLQARFRRVEFDVSPGTGAGEPKAGHPPAWLEFERSGNRMSFVDSAFNSAESERARVQLIPGGQAIVRPMTLREIFLALARTGRPNVKGAAA
jgi:ABC-2 type transport system ATP-binding protein